MEHSVDKHMNQDPKFQVFSETMDDSNDEAFYYPDDDGKLILTGIEVHVQLASPFKAFCSCRSIASPVTKLNVSKNPDVYKTGPAKSRKKVYDGFKKVLDDIVRNYKPVVSISNTHRDTETPLNVEEYIKWFYESKEFAEYGDVDEKTLNDLLLNENQYTCAGCRGEVGTLPYISPMSFLYAVGVCKVLDCKIANKVSFDRKCYEYFDLPKGYQVTQTLNPLGRDGHINLSTGKVVRVSKVQFEEDTARRVENNPDNLDFNRSGVALAEIVTAACELTRSEILETCRTIYERVVFNGLSNGNRFRGNFRFDINLSRPDGTNRIEVKNLNSFAVINKSVKNYDPEKEYKFKSEEPLESSVLSKLMSKHDVESKEESILDKIKNLFASVLEDVRNKDKYAPLGTTMKWDKEHGLRAMRHKLSSASYGNYFEVNIPVLYQSDELIKRITDCLPEQLDSLDKFVAKYPTVKRELLKEVYKHNSWVKYYEKLCSDLDPQVAASHFVNLLLPVVKATNKPLMPSQRFVELIKLVLDHRVNLSDVEDSMPHLLDYPDSFEEYFGSRNLLLHNLKRTRELIDDFLKDHPLDHKKSK
ncbi:aspartyl/glutamyl-tRNA amido transferase [Theileria orientalis]|uniref:Aspartyl/glutamyl-tRNA amido transferase n=1 Tax=Theileria orientalis TaxID=68886 RepID=A0A976M919_THEOR|nr:aspartyl/glutamyl-tRNA amido transferase [Theileria orientalis]